MKPICDYCGKPINKGGMVNFITMETYHHKCGEKKVEELKMTWLEHYKQISEGEADEKELQEVVIEHCPGFFFDYAPSAFPRNETILKCNESHKKRDCIKCWDQERRTQND